jgi:hypothetical protein
MDTQANASEPRQHPREGILAQLENITYSVLRKYGIGGESTREAVMSGAPQESAVQNDVHQEPLEARRSVASAISCISASQSKNKSRLRKEGTTMSANLVIVLSNSKPNRERRYPATWLLYSRGQDPLQVHVAHDNSDRPHVLDKGAA